MGEAVLVRRSFCKKLPELLNPGTSLDLLYGKELLNQDSEIITGNIPVNNENIISVNGSTIDIPMGYYGNDITKSVATVTQATPNISVDSTGKITATANQTEGYVSAGTKTTTKQLDVKTSNDLSASGATVTVPAGYYTSHVSKSVATVTRSDTTISVSADDTNDKLTITASNNQGTGYVTGANKTATTTITLTASGSSVTASDGTNKVSKSVATATQATPSISINSSGLITASATQTAGYVAAGTKSGTKQLTTQAAKTITPSSSIQTAVNSGVYTTGVIKVAAIPSSYTQLNFTVVGGTSQPSNPAANTIWVNTSTSISSWIFDYTKPANPSSGMVWIEVYTSSNSKFNVLKNNGIQIYPVSAQQYVNNAWVTKSAKIYQNGAWIEWLNGELYKYGDQCTAVTGGWSTTNQCTLVHNATYMQVNASSGKAGSAATTNRINLTYFETLVFKGYCNQSREKSILYVGDITQSNFNYITNNVASIQVPKGTAPIEVRLDVSGIIGNYNVGFGASESSVYCYEMYLE